MISRPVRMPSRFSLRRLVGGSRKTGINEGKTSDTNASTPQLAQGSTDCGHKHRTDLGHIGATSQESQRSDKDGLVLLNPATGQEQAKYNTDMIAVHGLGGDLFETWTHENKKLWLRDFLLADLPLTRVFTFGYNSQAAFSRETETFRGYARTLLEDIRSERTSPEVCTTCLPCGQPLNRA